MNADMERVRARFDKQLGSLKPTDQFEPPPKGWLRAIRDALGMTGVQFAKRLRVRPQTVAALEKSEADGTIQLKTLRRAAAALDCKIVYALVPNETLEGSVHGRARKIAMRALRRASHSMKLEAQETDEDKQDEQIESYIRNILKEREIWDEP
jgi:predicted DNA-binding mobile mystery protein A